MKVGAKIAIVYNEGSGDSDNLPKVLEARRILLQTFTRVDYFSFKDGKIDNLAKDYELVVAAGGDGTINLVAGKIINTDVCLGVLPLGTFNHFAKHIGIPLSLPEACRVIVNEKTELIDTGEVNGKIFLNFSFLGIYTKVAKERQEKRKSGWNKWIALLFALAKAVFSNPSCKITLSSGGRQKELDASFVLIGNNKYDIYGADFLSHKKTVDSSSLQIGIVEKTERRKMAKMFIFAILGRLEQAKNFSMLGLSKVSIRSDKEKNLVGLDGEVLELENPLQYRINPRSLKVIIP